MSKKAQKFNLIKDCIAQAMFELLKTKEFKDIKISELTEKAGVSRITYYRNFFDKKDVITYAFERYSEEWFEKNKDAKDPILVATSYMLSMKKPIQILYQANLSYILQDYIYRYIGPKENTPKDQIYYRAGMAGFVWGYINQWIKDDMKKTPEEVSEDVHAFERKIRPEGI